GKALYGFLRVANAIHCIQYLGCNPPAGCPVVVGARNGRAGRAEGAEHSPQSRPGVPLLHGRHDCHGFRHLPAVQRPWHLSPGRGPDLPDAAGGNAPGATQKAGPQLAPAAQRVHVPLRAGTVHCAGGRIPGQDSPGYLPDRRHAVQRRRVDPGRRAVLYPPGQRTTVPANVATV
ncbi:MAG: hypothetical protein AVDCRST_MAG56-5675, partial [uncultured Cytophagales bacterium]